MNAGRVAEIEAALGRCVVGKRSCPGGDINAAWLVDLDDGERVFVKCNAEASRLPGLFAAEAAGLAALRAAATTLRVPRVLAVGEAYLVLEAFVASSSTGGLEERLGRGLAALHRDGRAGRYGFAGANYLGRLPQDNAWRDQWVAFWREARLLPLLDRLRGEAEVVKAGRALADRLDEHLEGGDPTPTLIHGDLWSGNASLDADGRVWLYDPACYFACREAEFGMTRLFGFGPRFEAAYQEVYPLPAGWERRVEVYRLHHLLSHLWHFGSSYRSSCLGLLATLA